MKRKLMIVLTCAAIIIASIAFVACDNNKTALNDPRANANVLVVDTLMQPLQGATVTLATAADGQTVKSNADGIATFTNLKAGFHQAKVTLDGYAPMLIDINIQLPSMLGDTPVAQTTTETANMSKLGAAVAGKVEIQKNGLFVPLKDAPLKLMLDPTVGFAKVLYETTSDIDGKYTFTDLPENANYTITGAKVVSEDVIYVASYESNSTSFIWDGTTRITGIVEYTPEGEQFVVTSGKNLVMSAKNTPVVIDFSYPVNLATVRDSYISVSGSILADKVWSNNNKKLTITPVDGEWGPNSLTVVLDYRIQSTLGIQLGNNITITHKTTENNALANVGTITLSTDSNMQDENPATSRDVLKLQWTAIAGAKVGSAGYVAYYRYDSTESFRIINDATYSESGDTVTLNLSSSFTSADFAGNSSVEIIVFAKNDYGRSQKGTVYTINTTDTTPAP